MKHTGKVLRFELYKYEESMTSLSIVSSAMNVTASVQVTPIFGPLAAGMGAKLLVELQPLPQHVGEHSGAITLRTEGNIVVITTSATVIEAADRALQ